MTRLGAVRMVAIFVAVVILWLERASPSLGAALSGVPPIPARQRQLDLEGTFNAVDANGDGHWSVDELRRYLHLLDAPEEAFKAVVEAQVQLPLHEQHSLANDLLGLFQALDRNLDDRLNKEEITPIFTAQVESGAVSNITRQNSNPPMDKDRMDEWFRKIDKDQDGFLTPEEFQQEAWTHPTEEHEAETAAEQVIAEYDFDKDSRLDFDEFFAAAEIGSRSALEASDPESFTIEELKQLHAEFAQHDVDGDGTLSHAELVPFFLEEELEDFLDSGENELEHSDLASGFGNGATKSDRNAASRERHGSDSESTGRSSRASDDGSNVVQIGVVSPDSYSSKDSSREKFLQQFFQFRHDVGLYETGGVSSERRSFTKKQVIAQLDYYGPAVDFLLKHDREVNTGNNGRHADELR